MGMRLVYCVFLFITCVSLSTIADDNHISVVTEQAYPLQYSENNKVVGEATELVHAVLKASNVDYDISLLPWARAYQRALSEPNTLIYSIARTEQREQKFKWIGTVTTLDYFLVALDTLELEQPITLDSLKKLKIGVRRNSATHQYLEKQGFNNLYLVSNPGQNINMLNSKRIDLFPANYTHFKQSCLRLAVDCENLRPVFKLEGVSTSLYFAFSNATDDALVDRVRQAYLQVMRQ